MTFATILTLTGPARRPVQMLATQQVDGHSSVHDDRTAAGLGLSGAPIEGPTHFSQFDPLAYMVWRNLWFEHGCISCHFRTMVVMGDGVVASLATAGGGAASVEAHLADGTPVLTGTASVGPDHPPSDLDARRARQQAPSKLFIVDQLEVGMRGGPDDEVVTMTFDGDNGPLYPFSLTDKLRHISEPHRWYTPEGAAQSPWGRAIVPFEMISVLAHRSDGVWPVRSPSVPLFLDLEIRLVGGPIFVDQQYAVSREIIGLGESRRTESYWTRTTLTDVDTRMPVALVYLHTGLFKDSYPGYPNVPPP